MATVPISGIGTSTEEPCRDRHDGCGGFSLLELLIVVAIIGIFIGAAVLSIGITGDDRESERQAARLKGVLDLVREEALMQNRDYGVFFSASAYRFYTYDYGLQAWLAPTDDRLLAEHSIGEQFELALRVEDREIVLDEEFDPDGLEDPQPQLLILSSGEMTPFEARVFRDFDRGQYVLTGGVDGKIEIASRGFALP